MKKEVVKQKVVEEEEEEEELCKEKYWKDKIQDARVNVLLEVK